LNKPCVLLAQSGAAFSLGFLCQLNLPRFSAFERGTQPLL
jgi:hypothetical protein